MVAPKLVRLCHCAGGAGAVRDHGLRRSAKDGVPSSNLE
jgi:hypothetical protein